jgi:hypothetical protein
LRCQEGINTIQLTLTALPGRAINISGRSGTSIAVQESLFENQALVINATDPSANEGTRIQYWVRCLPHDFPRLSAIRPGAPSPGWYLTGNLNSVAGSSTYAMVLDANGTPVWYRKPAGQSAFDVTPLTDSTIAWKSTLPAWPSFEEYNLKTQTTRFLVAPIPPTDLHELEPMANGNLLMLAVPLTSDVDMSGLGFSSTATILDCVLQEVDGNGDLVWQWRASDHISAGESTRPSPTVAYGQNAYDPFHCNSMDTDPVTGNVLLSARNTDAVYLIDKSSGLIAWKMGGNAIHESGSQGLSIAGDQQGAFHAQHDARFEPNGDISLYDNQSGYPGLAARGAEYQVDTTLGTATLVWSFESPDGHNSSATGSFRRLNGGTDNVIGWGIKSGPLFTEVDSAGAVMLSVTFPDGELSYRVQKVGLSELDHDLLRATAGLAPFSSAPDSDPPITASGTTLAANEDTGFTNTVATFDDPDQTATPDGFLATIAWGDGSSSPGTISGPTGGPFTVTGSHTYAGPGTDIATVYISRVGKAVVKATTTSTVNVADAPLSAACATPAISLTSFGATVATFTDADPDGQASDHGATIAWGDGSSSTGVVSGPEGGPFTVNATHAYGSTGRFNVTTTINDVAGSTTSASCNSLVYAFPQGGIAFSIGDKNATTGAPITFGIAPSSRLDSTGGLVPPGFNDLWQKVAPTCRIDWSTLAGSGSPTVKRPLPDYMGVIVISPVRPPTSTGPSFAAHVVVVRTDPRYQNRGTVEAQIC